MGRVLVTGGSGFIGTNLVEHHRVNGDQVINLDIAPPRNSEHGIFWRKTDLLDREGLARAVKAAEPDMVYHMAARTDLEGQSVHEYPTNIEGVSNLIDAVTGVGSIRLVIFASSMLVCSLGYRPKGEDDVCPNTAYGASKVVGEQIVRKRASGKVPWVIVRPTSIWGPWFSTPYWQFFIAVQRGFYMHPRGRRIRRSYGFVLNSVAQLARIAAIEGGPLLGRTEYLADYEPIELKRWADTIQQMLGVRPVREVPLCLLRLAAIGGDVLKQFGYRTALNSARLNNLLTEVIHDTKLLRDACGNQLHSMEQGVRITCDWLCSQSA